MNMSLATPEKGFNVIGIAARTSNQKEMQEIGIIAHLWQRFFTEQILNTIPHKADHNILAVYYDFESDKSGEYSILIGARVNAVDRIPEGMDSFYVSTENKSIFISNKGSVQAIVMDTWQKIWSLEDQGKIKRIYNADYELYDERSLDPLNAQVEIHIGIE